MVGGYDLPSLEIASALFERIHPEVHPVSSLECAEMTKLVENTFRFVAIGFSNELSRIARAFGLNSWEVIGAARTKNFGFELCFPGLIGGHCIPIDPHYLSWALRNKRQIANFVDVAERAHQDMKRDALDLIQRSLNQYGRGFADSSVLFLGITYKKNVGDIRESAALELMKKLLSANATVSFWDPVRAKNTIRPRPRISFSDEERAFLSRKTSDKLELDDGGEYHFRPDELTGQWEAIKDRVLSGEFHCIVLATAHPEFDTSYNDLVFGSARVPLVDLANGVPSWIERSFSAELADQMKEQLRNQPSYMLVGYQ